MEEFFISKDFYCRNCKKFFDETEIDKTTKSFGLNVVQKRFCKVCHTNLDFVCNNCKQGFMKSANPAPSGDFTRDGYVEPFCTMCGHGYIKQLNYIVNEPDKYNKDIISKRNIKELVDKIFTRKGLPYNQKNEYENFIFQNCRSKEEIIDYLSDKFSENPNFIHRNLPGDIVSFKF
ncbi:MAG: hypothetical protein V5A64_06495 [Candidatus Thermoplasmatota archaeon]